MISTGSVAALRQTTDRNTVVCGLTAPKLTAVGEHSSAVCEPRARISTVTAQSGCGQFETSQWARCSSPEDVGSGTKRASTVSDSPGPSIEPAAPSSDPVPEGIVKSENCPGPN